MTLRCDVLGGEITEQLVADAVSFAADRRPCGIRTRHQRRRALLHSPEPDPGGAARRGLRVPRPRVGRAEHARQLYEQGGHAEGLRRIPAVDAPGSAHGGHDGAARPLFRQEGHGGAARRRKRTRRRPSRAKKPDQAGPLLTPTLEPSKAWTGSPSSKRPPFRAPRGTTASWASSWRPRRSRLRQPLRQQGAGRPVGAGGRATGAARAHARRGPCAPIVGRGSIPSRVQLGGPLPGERPSTGRALVSAKVSLRVIVSMEKKA